MQIRNDSWGAKAYSFIQNYGYITIYVLWFTFEIILGCSTAELTYSLNHKLYIYTERFLKFGLIFYIICFQKYSWKELLIIAPVSVLLYYTAKQAEFHELFYSWLFIIGAKNTSFDRIVRASFIMLTAYIPIIVLLCKTGILADAGVMRGEKFRSSLGFIHPNNFGARTFMLCACGLYLRREKLNIVDYISVLLIACFVWLVPNSRTSALCIVFLSGLIYICTHFVKQNVIKRKVYTAFLFCGALAANFGTVLLSVFYDPSSSFLKTIDNILSGRLSIAHELYDEFGISALGQRIYVTMSERKFAGLGEKAIYFDNSYMRILLHWGIIVYLLVSLFLFLLLIKESREKDLLLFTILTVVLLYSFSEKILYQAIYSVFIILGADILYKKISLQKMNAE